MLLRTICVAIFAGLSLALPYTPSEVAARSASAQQNGQFASTDGLLFNIDGERTYFAGTNVYWLGFLANDTDIDTTFRHIKASGLKVVRMWGFNDINNQSQAANSNGIWYQSLIPGQAPMINNGTNGLQRMDAVIRCAESYDIKLVINFVNNWSAYGGFQAYENYFGGNATSWFTNPRIQAQYQAYIRAVVTRHVNSPAIFAWELANEPRCHMCNTSVITTWATQTSQLIKSLDPNHMVTIGDEGWLTSGGDGTYPYTGVEGIDFVKNLQIPSIDYGVMHMYPNQWSESIDFATPWIEAHGAACAAAGKPCVLEEYGIDYTEHAGVEAPWQATSLATEGMGGDMYWQWGDTISTGTTPDDTYTVYYGTTEWQTLTKAHVQKIS